MPSAWLEKRRTKHGEARWRVRYRLGGRESVPRFGGSFKTQREALARKGWVLGELAAMRVPDIDALDAVPATAPTLDDVAKRWLKARVDVTDRTRVQLRVDVNRFLPVLGTRPVDEITPADVAELISKLSANGRKRETIKKSIGALAQVFDFAGLIGDRNPARDRITVRLPHEEREEMNPPTAAHIEAVYGALPARYRLPLLVLEQTGMRVGELESLTWGDLDEPNEQWRISRAREKTRRGRFVPVDGALFDAVTRLKPREDRDLQARVFADFTADRLRTAITRACTATGTPLFSPHDLRHRRISLWHRSGVPWAQIGQWVGQRSLAVAADTYTHVLADDAELDRFALRAQMVHTQVHTLKMESAD
jgi:integrase